MQAHVLMCNRTHADLIQVEKHSRDVNLRGILRMCYLPPQRFSECTVAELAKLVSDTCLT